MPAVVRIKRRIDEEPHTAFVLNGKRRRLLNDENAPAAATPNVENKEELNQVLLKFAGTLEKQDDSATKQFAAARLNKATAKELVRQTIDPAIASAQRRDKRREEAQQIAREQRYRVVNCLRTTLHDELEQDEEAASGSRGQEQSTAERRQITIVDIESQHTQRAEEEPELSPETAQRQQRPADSDIGYVYDLYVPENELQAQYVDMLDDNYLSLRPVDELFFEDCYNDDEDYDSEDSNQENYYTNEYPDDDDAGAVGSDEELCQQMNKFMFDDDEDEFASGGSSDAEDYNTYQDPYVHTIDTEADGFADDVDFYNVDRQGSAYERYKRRILREAEGLDSSSEDSDKDEPYFESASEHGQNSD
ncbi:probable RNA polymerase II nuclear localization protein SLC7A6OS isoform X1 [Drosophila virilis]|uniref:Probable RNA polymerase II nuclear localization protein SLC7A6OS n=1 Tax=Drosophila virilis TaxID=7244 RepID=B4LVG6_DROVI|nr:probable RNA polymerase II nuclear localization protein SLC7A6OS isoform X1 [Drosophila virilis]EDW63345.1 uncharacterized protein Dvir_GJ14672, isoform A [Drosophila virilis]